MDEVRLRLAINDLGDLLGESYKGVERLASNIAREVLGKYAYCPEPVRMPTFGASTVISAAFGFEPPLSDSSFGIIKVNISNIFSMSGDEQAKILLLHRFVDRLIVGSTSKEEKRDILQHKAHDIISNLSASNTSELIEPVRRLQTIVAPARGRVLSKSRSHHSVELPILRRVSWSFISDKGLKKIISRDYAELKRQRDAETYKGIIIMCGSILEAVLISVLMKEPQAKY